MGDEVFGYLDRPPVFYRGWKIIGMEWVKIVAEKEFKVFGFPYLITITGPVRLGFIKDSIDEALEPDFLGCA